MILETYIPSFPLSQFVDCFIYHRGYSPAHKVDRFLPDGNVEIIIDLNDKPQFIYDNQTLKEIQTCHHVWASGVRTEPITIPSGKESAMFIIAFKKGMAYPFFPLPMNEISDCVVDADLLWGDEFANLREQILENVEDKFLIVENFLWRNFSSSLVLNPCVEYALTEIVRKPDQISLSKLNTKIGYSEKHFIAMFKHQVGVTPKTYLKILRFQKAVSDIENSKVINWTAISNECGFYDQSHFINDFKHFSGFTPNEYANRKGDYLNYIPID